MSTPASCLLVGCGAVGSVCALTLERSKRTAVTVVARSNYDAVKEKGFMVKSIEFGEISGWKPSYVKRSVKDAIKHGPFDFIIVTTKNLPDVYSIPSIIEPAVDATSTIVLIQNGLGIEHPVAEAFPKSIILSAVSMIGAELKTHNEVIHTDPGDLILGPFYNELLSRSAQDAAARLFGEIYSGGGCKCTVTDDIAYYRWRKLAWNASFGPVCALTGLDSADVHRPENGNVMESILLPVIKEIVAAAAADGHHLSTSIIQDTLNNIPMESRFKPSMLVDCLKGRPMEIEGTLGAPLRIGKRLNVDMPVLSMLYQLLKGRQWSFVHKNV